MTPWTVAHQAHLSMEFSRQEYWNGWGAIPFSRGSSLARNWTHVCHIAGKFFTIWTTREVLTYSYNLLILFRQLDIIKFMEVPWTSSTGTGIPRELVSRLQSPVLTFQLSKSLPFNKISDNFCMPSCLSSSGTRYGACMLQYLILTTRRSHLLKFFILKGDRKLRA